MINDPCADTVSGVVYSESRQLLYIRYRDNSLYLYRGVENFEYEALKVASPLDFYINRSLKRLHFFEKVE